MAKKERNGAWNTMNVLLKLIHHLSGKETYLTLKNLNTHNHKHTQSCMVCKLKNQFLYFHDRAMQRSVSCLSNLRNVAVFISYLGLSESLLLLSLGLIKSLFAIFFTGIDKMFALRSITSTFALSQPTFSLKFWKSPKFSSWNLISFKRIYTWNKKIS